MTIENTTSGDVAATIDAAITSGDVVAFIKSDGATTLPILREDPEAVAARIKQRSLDAASEAELFGESTVLHAQDYVGMPFKLLSVQWRNSDQAEGFPVYALLSIVTPDGDVVPMSTGAESVLLKVAVADAKGFLPTQGWLKITKADTATAAGYFPLDIERADAPETGPVTWQAPTKAATSSGQPF